MDSLYFVVDKSQCVFDWSYVTIDASDPGQSPFYADNYNSQCLSRSTNFTL